jgi:serine/threonine-protein kinase
MHTTLPPGSIFAMRYRVLAPLGSGGMGRVYRAEHVALGRSVAIKVLDPDAPGVPDPDGKRFEREARALARLDHPSVVRVLDHGRTVDRLAYLVMELLDGPSLAAHAARARPGVAEAVRIATDVLDGLAHAHRAGVLHRDVKPENVVLAWRDGRPRAVLVDFGLARLADAPALTATGVCVGSPAYLAPERVLGRGHDGRADVYAVGVMLYELLAGRRPFTGSDDLGVACAHVRQPPPPLGALAPEVSPQLADVVMRALAKRPEGRWAGASEMRAALDAVPAAEAAARMELAETIALGERRRRAPLARRLWGLVRHGRWRWPAAAWASTPARAPR